MQSAKLIIYLLMIILVSLPLSFGADNFATEACQVSSYLKCVNIDTSNCIKANDLAYKQCLEKYPLNLDSTQEESNKAAKLFGKCTTEQYISNMGVDRDRFELCSLHLKPGYDKYLEAARKKLEESNRRFFEEDDPLHSYSK